MPSARCFRSLRNILMIAFCALPAAGCAQRGNIETLESELRKKEIAEEEVAGELARARYELKLARAMRLPSARSGENRQTALSPERRRFFTGRGPQIQYAADSGQDRDGAPATTVWR